MFNIMDITQNISKERYAVRNLRGMEARSIFFMTLFLELVMLWFMWVLDIQSTYIAVVSFLSWGGMYLDGFPLWVAGVLMVLLTFTPTLVQLAYSRSATVAPMSAAIVFVTLLFDAVTDYPVAYDITHNMLVPAVANAFGAYTSNVWFLESPLTVLVLFLGGTVAQTIFFSKLPVLFDLLRYSQIERVENYGVVGVNSGGRNE
jgi:hypothetical protein